MCNSLVGRGVARKAVWPLRLSNVIMAPSQVGWTFDTFQHVRETAVRDTAPFLSRKRLLNARTMEQIERATQAHCGRTRVVY